MKQKLIMILSLGTAILMSCCSSVKNASLGGGSYPGKDYVTSLRPSAAARQYFAQIGNKSPIETLTRANAGRSKSGVRFVANDGILIPAGVTIQFYNKGYCMDPKLPAPVSNEEYQLVPTSALIPSQLQGIYQNLVKRAAAGDTTVKSNMQGLVWALRTAGTEGSYAARLSSTQKRILDSCSSRPGEFERVHNSGLATGRLVGELWKLADSAVNVRFGNRTWKPSDFSSAGAFNSAINSQLDSLISMGSKLPIPRTGFNYGEPEPGIYTDINGAGLLAFNAKIANSTNKDFIFYPSNYVGQVGSGSVLSAVSFAASSSVTQRQRVTMGPIGQVNVLGVYNSSISKGKYDKEATITGTHPIDKDFNNLKDLFNKPNIEQAALIYSINGELHISDIVDGGSGGMTIKRSNSYKVLAGIHSHPLGGLPVFSVADVSCVIRRNVPEIVFDRTKEKLYVLEVMDALYAWNLISKEMSGMGVNVPSSSEIIKIDLYSLKSLIETIDSKRLELSDEQENKIYEALRFKKTPGFVRM